MNGKLAFLPIAALFCGLAGCAVLQPDLTQIYAKQEGMVDQPPVVVIHGALGGRLYDHSAAREIWPGGVTRVLFSDYESLRMDIDATTLLPQMASVMPSGIANRIGGVDFYGRILDVLKDAGGYGPATIGTKRLPLEKRYYVFSYDWRQDNVHTARRLNSFIEDIRTDYNNPELKVDIVAHSMGGLITRYFARYGTRDVLDGNDFPVSGAGAEKIRRVILLGTPNLGSAGAFRTLSRGYKVLFGTVPIEVVATFPSTYQVLPHAINEWLVNMDGSPLHRDQFDVALWADMRLSIYDPVVEKRILKRFDTSEAGKEYLSVLRAFFEKHLERARRFSWSLTVPVENLKTEYIVFGSDCVDTPARMVVEDVAGVAKVRLFPKEIESPLSGVDYHGLMMEPGDGIVTKASLMARQTFDPTVSRHEYSDFPLDYPIFLCESHSQLTGNIHFQNNLLHALLSVDR